MLYNKIIKTLTDEKKDQYRKLVEKVMRFFKDC